MTDRTLSFLRVGLSLPSSVGLKFLNYGKGAVPQILRFRFMIRFCR